MIGSWDITGLTSAQLHRELAIANIDASIHLCQGMVSGALPSNFHMAKVTMSLAYHGVELFLKYGIRRKHETQRVMGIISGDCNRCTMT
jgi:hypothetical protein